MLAIAALAASTTPTTAATSDARAHQSSQSQILHGRQLVMEHACSECHGGNDNPAAMGWLDGDRGPLQEFKIGPCAVDPDAKPCFTARAKNLTPDNETGTGKYSERQIFNALRYGLRPEETPDVVITSMTPGKGNFPASPKYLAPAMPWAAWRHMPDSDLWAIAAYLKRGVKPSSHKVQDSDRPADAWASMITPQNIGAYPAVAFPAASERAGEGVQAQVRRGRYLVISHDCAGCHGGADPTSKGWLSGVMDPSQEFKIGPCFVDPKAQPCFTTRPKNLTPDNTTGTGRFSERQIFNALRYGLRPEETPDVKITSSTPGQGNFPVNPHYLAPPMPWPSWRHMSDADLMAIAAYLKHGLKPNSNKVADSDGPPDFWASSYTPKDIGTYPPPKYPTANEK
jgi:mono/diheme cytochrome c family protein